MADKGQKRPLFSFKPPKTPKSQKGSVHNYKNVPKNNPPKISNSDLAFAANKG